MDGQPHDVVITPFDSFDNQTPAFLDRIPPSFIERKEVVVISTNLRLSQFVEKYPGLFHIGKKLIIVCDAYSREHLMVLARKLPQHPVRLFQAFRLEENSAISIDNGVGCEDYIIRKSICKTLGFSDSRLFCISCGIALKQDEGFIEIGTCLSEGDGKKVQNFAPSRRIGPENDLHKIMILDDFNSRIIYHFHRFMAAPVQQQQPAAPPPPPAPRLEQQPAPRGVGEAPSTIQGPQTPERGYVETFVHWVIGWVSWAIKKICCCFYRDEQTPPPPAEPPMQRPELDARIQTEVRLLNALDRLTEVERNRIYRRIGDSVSAWYYPGQWRRSVEETGRLEVERNPLLLQQYININQH